MNTTLSISDHPRPNQDGAPFGISAISTYCPPREIPNAWYEETLPRKFVNHTGIVKRSVSFEDEVTMAHRCLQQLVRETGCQLSDCAAVVFASPSFVPMAIANRVWGRDRARQEQLSRAADRFVKTADLHPRRVAGINGFCAGYAKALAVVKDKLMPGLSLSDTEFVLVVTASQISRITDFSCKQTGGLFGDFATATLISRCDSHKYPVKLEVVDAKFEKSEVRKPFFDFSVKEDVVVPTEDGGRGEEKQRLVFSLDGMGIADMAPRAMAASAAQMLESNAMNPEDVQRVVPHQAGNGIVRFTGMKLEEAGVTADVVTGMTKEVGNISSGSVPFALKSIWNELQGNILCPVAAVGSPGKPEVSQGCILLRSNLHQHSAAA